MLDFGQIALDDDFDCQQAGLIGLIDVDRVEEAGIVVAGSVRDGGGGDRADVDLVGDAFAEHFGASQLAGGVGVAEAEAEQLAEDGDGAGEDREGEDDFEQRETLYGRR